MTRGPEASGMASVSHSMRIRGAGRIPQWSSNVGRRGPTREHLRPNHPMRYIRATTPSRWISDTKSATRSSARKLTAERGQPTGSQHACNRYGRVLRRGCAPSPPRNRVCSVGLRRRPSALSRPNESISQEEPCEPRPMNRIGEARISGSSSTPGTCRVHAASTDRRAGAITPEDASNVDGHAG
jgi:hypothetical protein